MTDVALALMRRVDRWFLQRRDPANPVMPGLWEFPGGKAQAGETPVQAMERELREEVALVPRHVESGPILEGPVRLHAFLVEAEGEPRTDLAWGWFTAAEILRLPIPPRNEALLHWLTQDRSPSDLIG